ncbi:MAG: hypothetical protein RL326_2022 [Pseudomonadota bacterium]
MTSNTARAGISPPAETEFTVCARLLRALSHIVRGDLSVITNDLTYLSTIAPPEELERPRARCASAAATLGKVNIITGSMSLEGISLSAIVRELGGTCEVESALVRGDSRKLAWIGQTLRGLIDGLVVRSVTRAPRDSFVFECYAGSSAERERRRGSLNEASYSSLGEYASHELGEREVVEASLLDLLFHGFTWELCLESDAAGVVLRLVVPREDKER